MANKQIYHYDNGATLIYYQQNYNKSTNFTIGFKLPSDDVPKSNESIYKYKNVVFYVNDDDPNDIRVPLVKPGLKHFLEHMFDHSSEDFDRKDIYDFFRKSNTIDNAYTTQNCIVVTADCPTKYLQENLKVHSKMLLRKDFPESDVEEEKKIVLQELTMKQDEYAAEAFNFVLGQISSRENQGSVEILGISKDILDTITPNELSRFARTHFTSENLIMSVVSDLPFDEVKKMVDEYFVSQVPSIPASNVKPYESTYFLDEDIDVPVEIPSKNTINLAFYFKGTNNYEENEKMQYLEDYIFNGFNGRLMNKFRIENQLTYTPIFMNVPLSSTFNLKCFNIQTTPENADIVVDIFTDLIRELAENGVTDEEMDSFKEHWASHRLRKTEVKTHNSSYLFQTYLSGQEVFIHDMHEKVASITKEEFNKYFMNNYIHTTMIFSPSGNINAVQLPRVGELVTYLRPYENYAYDTILDNEAIETLQLDYVEKLKELRKTNKEEYNKLKKEFTLVKLSEKKEIEEMIKSMIKKKKKRKPKNKDKETTTESTNKCENNDEPENNENQK